MIIAKLLGGLGNQMFQYAFARRIAIANNAELKLDINGFVTVKVNTPRQYELSVFNIKEKFATAEEIKYFEKFAKQTGSLSFFHNLFVADQKHYVKQKGFGFNKEYLKVGGKAYLDGLWASEKYFTDIENQLRKDFTPKTVDDYYLSTLAEIKAVNSVSLHFRRGDYVNDPGTNRHHGVTGFDYYQQAMKIIEEKIKDPVYFVFSDDIEWVKNNLKTNQQVHFIKQPDQSRSYQDLLLMSQCSHNIIANSTFSWWGAWLNQNKDKIVCSPAKWFNFDRDISDLLPESWIKI
jgi:hypothetical protein